MCGLVTYLGLSASSSAVAALRPDTFGFGIGAPATLPAARRPWYELAYAPAGGADAVAAAAGPAPGLLGVPALGPTAAAALAAVDAATDPYLYDDDGYPQVCSTVEDGLAGLPHEFSRQVLHEELGNFDVQPWGAGDVGSVTWRPLPPGTALYATQHGGRPDVRDIRQSVSLGDCYFLGALAGVVANNPQFIVDGLREQTVANPLAGVRYYHVRYFLRDSLARTVRALDVAVDDRQPINAAGRVGAFTYDFRNRSDTAAWPAIYEKAFAKLQRAFNINWEAALGDYSQIGVGGHHQALTALTGQAAATRSLMTAYDVVGESGRMRDDELDYLFSEVADPHHITIVVLRTFDTFQVISDSLGVTFFRPGYCAETQMVRWRDGMNLTARSGSTLVLGSADGRLVPLVTDHAYTVVGTDPDNYYLYNPWGSMGASRRP